MLEITNNAKNELTKLLQSEDAQNKQLVIYFQGFGWSGPSLGMALDESIDGLEKVISNSIETYMDPKLISYLDQLGQVTIDYLNSSLGGRYQIIVGNNSCSDGSCGGSCWVTKTGFDLNPVFIFSLNENISPNLRQFLYSGLPSRHFFLISHNCLDFWNQFLYMMWNVSLS